MATTAVYNDFRAPESWRTKYRRSIMEIWDANLHHGDVRPFACPEPICNSRTEKLNTLYDLQDDCCCFGHPDVRDTVQGFCDDQHFTIQNGVLMQATTWELCNHRSLCRAGVPYQKDRPRVGGGCGVCDGVGVSYVITYVTEHAGVQIEGAPSPPSVPVNSNGLVPGVSVSWSGAPSGYCVTKTRLYRSETTFEDMTTGTDRQGAEYVLVGEFTGGGGGAFSDNVSSSETGGPLLTYNPMAFPAPTGLVALVRTKDGIAVADSNRVYISVSGKPQFTFDSVVEVEDTIRAMTAIDNTIFVFTDRYPVRIQYEPSTGLTTIDKSVIKRNLPFKSKKSLSNYNGRIYFASTYSLYMWNTAGYGDNISSLLNPLLTPEQWKSIDSESVVGTAYEYGYIFTSDTMDYSLMVEIGEDGTDTKNNTSLMPISYINPHVFGLDKDGHIIYQEDNQCHRWDYRRDFCNDFYPHDNEQPSVCEECECCPWDIKLYYDAEGKNRFNHMRVEWDERSYDGIDIRFHAHDFEREWPVTDWMKIISSREFGIPKNSSYQTNYAHLKSCAIMHEVRFATSAEELVISSNRYKET